MTTPITSEAFQDEQTGAIIDAGIVGHKKMGRGFLESIYPEALSAVTPREMFQVMNYLGASGLQRGLLLNFGAATLETRRVVWGFADDPPTPKATAATD